MLMDLFSSFWCLFHWINKWHANIFSHLPSYCSLPLGVEKRMAKSESEEMIEIEIDGQDKQACLEEGWVMFAFDFCVVASRGSIHLWCLSVCNSFYPHFQKYIKYMFIFTFTTYSIWIISYLLFMSIYLSIPVPSYSLIFILSSALRNRPSQHQIWFNKILTSMSQSAIWRNFWSLVLQCHWMLTTSACRTFR